MRSYRSRKRYHNFLFLYESAPEERSAAVIDTNENSWIEDFVICLRNNKKLVDSRAHQNVAEDPGNFPGFGNVRQDGEWLSFGERYPSGGEFLI